MVVVGVVRGGFSPRESAIPTTLLRRGVTSAKQILCGSDRHVFCGSPGTGITNYDAESVAATKELHDKCDIPCRIMIDCSHGNSKKKAVNQPVAAAAVADQLTAGCRYELVWSSS